MFTALASVQMEKNSLRLLKMAQSSCGIYKDKNSQPLKDTKIPSIALRGVQTEKQLLPLLEMKPLGYGTPKEINW